MSVINSPASFFIFQSSFSNNCQLTFSFNDFIFLYRSVFIIIIVKDITNYNFDQSYLVNLPSCCGHP